MQFQTDFLPSYKQYYFFLLKNVNYVHTFKISCIFVVKIEAVFSGRKINICYKLLLKFLNNTI